MRTSADVVERRVVAELRGSRPSFVSAKSNDAGKGGWFERQLVLSGWQALAASGQLRHSMLKL